eukprot:CAMPEP_0181040190 /NCGR_PEP_ID=MMETSP1070-20121207/10911_1 /TAXON_ID=265543 /ORGANISM="Minutocellus polymorphus, Strain NH13" /LENGTH=81 /DNA_ID=CAMNT_0023118173 /DNA_START=734 /DNA_END=979 /DNA_ORIENTATION=+
MAKMEMDEWVRQRKTFLGETVAKMTDDGDCLSGEVVDFKYNLETNNETEKNREKEWHEVKHEGFPVEKLHYNDMLIHGRLV